MVVVPTIWSGPFIASNLYGKVLRWVPALILAFDDWILMDKILIAGCGGFVGRHLATHLVAEGLQVVGVGRNVPIDTPKSVQWLRGDIRDRNRVYEIISQTRPQYVCNLVSAETAGVNFEINVGGPLNLFDAVRDTSRTTRVLNVSSGSVYGALGPGASPFSEQSVVKPTNPYAASKVMVEQLANSYVRAFDMKIATVRPFAHIGPGQPSCYPWSDIARKAAALERSPKTPTLTLSGLDDFYDFTDVRDAAQAYWVVLKKGAPGEVYNVCSGELHSMAEVIHLLVEIAGVRVAMENAPTSMTREEVPRSCGVGRRIKRDLGWCPRIPFEQSILDLFEYWRTQPPPVR